MRCREISGKIFHGLKIVRGLFFRKGIRTLFADCTNLFLCYYAPIENCSISHEDCMGRSRGKSSKR